MSLSDSDQRLLSGSSAFDSELLLLGNEMFFGYGSRNPDAGENAAVGIQNALFGSDILNKQDLFVYNIMVSVDNIASKLDLHHTKIDNFLPNLGDTPGLNMILKADTSNRAGQVVEDSSTAANLGGAGGSRLMSFIPNTLGTIRVPFKGLFKIAPGVTLYLYDTVTNRRLRATYQWYETPSTPADPPIIV